MKTIEEEFPPRIQDPIVVRREYARLRARAVKMERAQGFTLKIREYRDTCVATYGKFPTDYESGVLQGIDCALALLPPAPEIHQTNK